MPTLQQQATAYVRRWFQRLERKTFAFQEETWQAFLNGEQGLVNAPTGNGKTIAVFLGPVIEWLAENRDAFRKLQRAEKTLALTGNTGDFSREATRSLQNIPPLKKRTSIERLDRTKTVRRKLPAIDASSKVKILWITPLRALATDTTQSLATALDQLGIPWQIEKRTGDTDPAIRNRQKLRFPEVLVTTPESLTLMLSWPGTLQRFSDLKLLAVDEWHDLMGTKRGVQTELALARLRRIQPQARVWGMSATIGNLEEALTTLCGLPFVSNLPSTDRVEKSTSVDNASEVFENQTNVADVQVPPPARLIRAKIKKEIEIKSLIPPDIERFPWAGHLGIRLAPQVAELIAANNSSLVFTNTRSQTEMWYRALLSCDPNLAGQIGVHHGSLDRGLRQYVEDALREGKLKCCVCTASLDLGVDFTVVDHVIQIGSPKGNARLLQRAGRSGHQPGVPSRVTFVPTNAIELVELAAVRDSIAAGKIESLPPRRKPLDVLAQHVVTIALGGGFVADDLLAEVRSTHAYQDLTVQEWQWVLDFAERGGSSLQAYPDFHRIKLESNRFTVSDPKIARFHRLSIGTIVSDAAIKVKYLKGGSLGTVEESFVSRIEPGDRFMLGGKVLELIKIHDNVAWVKKATGKTNAIPRWTGGRMPLSAELSRSIREKLQAAKDGYFESPEMKSVQPLLEIQNTWSIIPGCRQLLIERLKNRDGFHLFFYPFDGRLVHEGMAALFAWRLSRLQPISFSMAMNDYGFVLVSPTEPDLKAGIERGLFAWDNVGADILSSLNASEMAKRQFREIARVAGLIFEGYPGTRKSARHLQASSNLFYDVFTEYDPNNMLLLQARREVLEQQLEEGRLVESLQRLSSCEIVIRDLQRSTPLAFPLIVDGLRDRLSSEKLADRIRRMQVALEIAVEKSAKHSTDTKFSA